MISSSKRKRVLVTGCAGFIGSHLSERLLSLGHEVIGVDCFTDYYPREIKESNLVGCISNKNFKMLEIDLAKDDLTVLPTDIYAAFHLAAQPGVRHSWGDSFVKYVERNVVATQRLLEFYKQHRDIRFVVASSSSVYGEAKVLPVSENAPLMPISPYGVTKVAMEKLLYAYHTNFNLNITILRYFTVYGPRQRPDMAFYNIIKSALCDREIVIFGDGKQTRDFTFIEDAIQATLHAMEFCQGFEIFNIASGKRVSLLEVLDIIASLLKKKLSITFSFKQKGDVNDTFADISKAKRLLDYDPKTSIDAGIEMQLNWQIKQLNKHESS